MIDNFFFGGNCSVSLPPSHPTPQTHTQEPIKEVGPKNNSIRCYWQVILAMWTHKAESHLSNVQGNWITSSHTNT